jgi:serine O-acetyltransferase
MKGESLTEYIKSDLFRICGKINLKDFVNHFLFDNQFKVTFWFRVTSYLARNNHPILMPFLKFNYRRVCRRHALDIPYQTKIGKGLLIYHGFGIVINKNAVLGNNVTLSHEVTIGDEKGHSPVIGDKVLISPGAKIFGEVTIGENSIIGANSVVIHSVPVNSVSVGIPNRVLDKKNASQANRNYWERS